MISNHIYHLDRNGKINGNFYHNLLSALILADINNSDKSARLYYLDNTITLCNIGDSTDHSFLTGTNQLIAESYDMDLFMEIPDFVDNYAKADKNYDDILYYNSDFMVVDLSVDTIERYITSTGILDMDPSIRYDRIAELITNIQIRAQQELQKYLRNIKRKGEISFGDLYKKMILDGINPLSDDQYYRIPFYDTESKTTIILLLGNMNNIYRRYQLYNMELTMLYMNTVMRAQIQEENCFYGDLFRRIGMFSGNRLNIMYYNNNDNYITSQRYNSHKNDCNAFNFFRKCWFKMAIQVANEACSIKEMKGSDNIDKKDHHTSISSAQYYEGVKTLHHQNGYNVTSMLYQLPYRANVHYNANRHLFIANSLYNLVHSSRFINSLSELCESKSTLPTPHIYKLYLPNISRSSKQRDNTVIKKRALAILSNLTQYESLTLSYREKRSRNLRRQCKHVDNHNYSYGELALFPSIDPMSSLGVDYKIGLPMLDCGIKNSRHYISALGNSVFSGHIQCHNLSPFGKWRLQYLAPIWLRPLYGSELLVTGTKETHLTNYSNNEHTSSLILDNLTAYEYIMSSIVPNVRFSEKTLQSMSMFSRSARCYNYHANSSDSEFVNFVFKTSLASMILMRMYMIGVIHMMVSNTNHNYLILAPTKEENECFMKDFSANKKSNIYISDFKELCTISLIDSDECYNQKYNTVTDVTNEFNPARASRFYQLSRLMTLCDNMSLRENNKKVNMFFDYQARPWMFENMQEIYTYDSLKLSPELADQISTIAKEDLHGYYQL